MLNHRALVSLATLALFAPLAYSQAEQLTYFGLDNPRDELANSFQARDSFLATLSSYGIETMEDIEPFVPNPTLTFGDTGITAETQTGSVVEFPPLAVSGSRALLDLAGPDPDADPIPDVFTFSQPVTAFGAFFANAGDGPANTITLLLENTVLGTSKEVVVGTLGPLLAFNAIFFFGVTDTDPFNRVSMIESYDYDGILLDDMIVGYVRVIPEPSSLILAGLGGLLLIGIIRRRRDR